MQAAPRHLQPTWARGRVSAPFHTEHSASASSPICAPRLLAPCTNGCLGAAPDRARPGVPACRQRCEHGARPQRCARRGLNACPPCAAACRAEPLGRVRPHMFRSRERRYGSAVTLTLTSALRSHAGRRLLCDGVLCPVTGARRGDQGTQAARPAARTLQQDASPTGPPTGEWLGAGARSTSQRSALSGSASLREWAPSCKRLHWSAHGRTRSLAEHCMTRRAAERGRRSSAQQVADRSLTAAGSAVTRQAA